MNALEEELKKLVFPDLDQKEYTILLAKRRTLKGIKEQRTTFELII